MKKSSFLFLLAALGVGISGVAKADSRGPYVVFAGGGVYLLNSKLGSTTVTRADLDPFTHTYTIKYSQNNAFGYTGRGALGYYFYQDPTTSYALGFEVGYNYFSPIKGSVNNNLVVPFDRSYRVTTTQTTKAWSTDAVLVYRQSFAATKLNLLFKLGAGYQSTTNQITNSVDLPDQLPASQTIHQNGFGVAAGFGVEYPFTSHFAIRTEVDGLKGTKGVGNVQGLLGLVLSF